MADSKTGHKGSRANICFTCENACGRCPWSSSNPETGKPNFEPVPGWTAEVVKLMSGTTKNGKHIFVDTYHITACPLYKPSRKR